MGYYFKIISTGVLLSAFLSGCGGSSSSSSDQSAELQANNDRYETDRGEQINLNVLANDVIPEGRTVTISILPSDNVRVQGDMLIFTSPDSDSFTSEFSYTITDNFGNIAQATVTIIQMHDDTFATLTANSDSAVTNINQTIIFDVIANDVSSVDDILTLTEIVSAPTNGQASIQNNTVLYEPNPDFSGVDYFTYRVDDQSGNSFSGEIAWVLVEDKINERYLSFDLESIANFNLSDLGNTYSVEYPFNIDVLANGIGDINGDGFSDAISCFTANTVQLDAETQNNGECFIYLGNPEGILAPTTRLISGLNSVNAFGQSVRSIGDFNGDNLSDTLFVVPEGLDFTSYIVWGSQTMQEEIVLSADTPEDIAIRLITLGELLNIDTVGDVNSDGKNDLLLFTELETNSEREVSASIIFGGLNETSVVETLTAGTERFIYEEGQINEISTESFTFVNYAIRALGDINEDQLDDFMIYVENEFSVLPELGAMIVFGEDNYNQGSSAFTSSEQMFITHENHPTNILRLGKPGDYNDDGDYEMIFHFGSTAIIYSLADAKSGEFSIDDDERTISEIKNVNSSFGINIENLGDINGDMIDDIAIHTNPNSSHIQLLYGNANFPEEITRDDLLRENNADGSIGAIIAENTTDTNRIIGDISDKLGDFNNDGYADYIIGGKGDTIGQAEGEITVLYGGEHWGR